MPKNKTTYLPIEWAKKLEQQTPAIFGTKDIDPMDLRIFSNRDATDEQRAAILAKYPALNNMIRQSMFLASTYKNSTFDAMKETLSDIDAMSLLLLWARNKQSFKIDADFADELLRTENLRITKDAWDYLPYDIFYIDISNNKELCDMVIGKGFIVYPEKSTDNNTWYIHVCKLTEKFFFSDVIIVGNEDGTFGIDTVEQHTNVNLVDVQETGNGFEVQSKEEAIDSRTFLIFVVQILTYLSSVEPDIHENATTKQTYKPPAKNTKPKNKFSEVRAWDVGVRFGTAFRKYTSDSEAHTTKIGSSHSTSSKKRPHMRRAHWHSFWYGKHDGERTLRAKWVPATFINAPESDNESPVTIHKTS